MSNIYMAFPRQILTTKYKCMNEALFGVGPIKSGLGSLAPVVHHSPQCSPAGNKR